MVAIETWFAGLHIGFKCLFLLLVSPVVCTLVGLLIFVMEPPNDDFWFWRGKTPSLWRLILGTAAIGFIGSVLIALIFALFFLLSVTFLYFNAGSWSIIVSFILALIIVLGGVAYWFEFRR